MIKTLSRLFFVQEDGLIGKLWQIGNAKEIDTTNCPNATDVFPDTLLRYFRETPQIAHRGTIGVIYVATYNSEKVALKTVLLETKNTTISDATTIKKTNTLTNIINPDATKMFDTLVNNLLNETNIEHEKQMCTLLEKTPYVHLSAVPELNNHPNIFAYKYVDGKTLQYAKTHYSKYKLERLMKNIAEQFYTMMHKYHILYGDMNSGNILCKEETPIFIDYGCVIPLGPRHRELLKQLLNVLDDYTALYETFARWDCPDAMIDSIYEQSSIFLKKDTERKPTLTFTQMMSLPEMAFCKMPHELVLPVRAIYQLVELIKWFDVPCCIKDVLVALNHY